MSCAEPDHAPEYAPFTPRPRGARRRKVRPKKPRKLWLVDDFLPEFSIKAYCRLCLGSGSTTRSVRAPSISRRGGDGHDDGSGGDDGGDGPPGPPIIAPPSNADASISKKHSPAHNLPDGWDRMSFEALYSAIMRRRTEDCVTISTFHAVRFALRNGGLAALNKQAERLRGFSDQQIESLIRDLHENRNRFKAGGDPKLLRALTELMP